MNAVNDVNYLHRVVCNGVQSEIDHLVSKGCEDYASRINAWKYELHLKQEATKEK